MIIYGRKPIKLNNPQKQACDCASCNSEKSFWFYFFLNTYHIYWIPLFPLGKYGYSQCSKCYEILYDVQMPEPVKSEFNENYKQLKTSMGYKIGLATLIGLVIYSFIK